MAKPTARTELGGAKVLILADATVTTPVALSPAAVQQSTSGESTYPVGWLGIATHREADTNTQPGGFTGLATANGPCILIAGKTSGGVVTAPIIATTTPGGSDAAIVVRNIPSGTQAVSGTVTITPSGVQTVTGSVTITPSGTQTVAGTVTANQGGTWNVGTLTSLTNALPAGTNVIGDFRFAGWDSGAVAVQRGLAVGITATTAQTLLAADASNLYNVYDVTVTVFTGTTAPAAETHVSLRHGAAGTEFLRIPIPTLANETVQFFRSFVMPDRGSLNQVVEAQLSAALGTNGQYSCNIHAFKTTS